MFKQTVFVAGLALLFSSCFFSSSNKAEDNIKLIPVVTDERGEEIAESFIRVNQVGFKRNELKTAVVLSKTDFGNKKYNIKDIKTGKVVFTDNIPPSIGGGPPPRASCRVHGR